MSQLLRVQRYTIFIFCKFFRKKIFLIFTVTSLLKVKLLFTFTSLFRVIKLKTTNIMKRLSVLIPIVLLLINIAPVNGQNSGINTNAKENSINQKYPPHTKNTNNIKDDDIVFVIDTACVYSFLNDPQRYTYTYSDKAERLTTLHEKTENGNWVNHTLKENTYDGFGNIIFEVWKTWVNNNWEYSDRTTFIYSAENYLITKIKDVWTNGNWESSERDSYSYNTSGKVVSFVKELWTNGNWVNNSKTVYVYNDEGDLTYLIQELWKNDVWVNDKQFVYNYDSNHNQTSMISQTWNSGEWFNVSKDSSNYNSSNKKTLYLYQTWNDSLWKNLFKYNYEYNNLDYVETSTMMTWEDSLWVNSEKINYSYGAYGAVENELKKTWTDNDWTDYSMKQYTYDEYGNAQESNYYFWEGVWTQNKDDVIEVAYDYNTKQETFYGYHVHAAYSSMIVNVEENKSFEKNITINPNPADKQIVVNIKPEHPADTVIVGLLDINGKIIERKKGKPDGLNQKFVFDTSGLPSGIYFVSMIHQNKRITKKVIIQH